MSSDDILRVLLVRIEEMRDALTALEATLGERCPAQNKRLARVELILDGPASDGKNPGLGSRVGLIEKDMRGFKSLRREVRGTLAAVLSGMAVVLFAWFFKG